MIFAAFFEPEPLATVLGPGLAENRAKTDQNNKTHFRRPLEASEWADILEPFVSPIDGALAALRNVPGVLERTQRSSGILGF